MKKVKIILLISIATMLLCVSSQTFAQETWVMKETKDQTVLLQPYSAELTIWDVQLDTRCINQGTKYMIAADLRPALNVKQYTWLCQSSSTGLVKTTNPYCNFYVARPGSYQIDVVVDAPYWWHMVFVVDVW